MHSKRKKRKKKSKEKVKSKATARKEKQKENKYKRMKFDRLFIVFYRTIEISSFYPFLSTISELYLVARVDYFFFYTFLRFI